MGERDGVFGFSDFLRVSVSQCLSGLFSLPGFPGTPSGGQRVHDRIHGCRYKPPAQLRVQRGAQQGVSLECMRAIRRVGALKPLRSGVSGGRALGRAIVVQDTKVDSPFRPTPCCAPRTARGIRRGLVTSNYPRILSRTSAGIRS